MNINQEKDGFVIVQANSRIVVNKSSLGKTLQSVNDLTGAQLKGILATEKVLVPPSMEKKQLSSLVASIVQIAWTRKFDPENKEHLALLEQNHAVRVKKYIKEAITPPELSQIGKTMPKLVEKNKKKVEGAVAKERKAIVYKLTKKGDAELQTSEAKQVVQLYKNLKKEPSTQHALTELVTGTDFTKSPNPATIVAYYLSTWKKQGFLEVVS